MDAAYRAIGRSPEPEQIDLEELLKKYDAKADAAA